MKKLITVDLDGTLLTKNGKASKNTMTYLEKLKKDGHIITIATGRRFASALSATENAYFANYVICHGGSLIYNTTTHEFIYKDVIKKDLIENICMFYNKYSSIILCTTDKIYKIESKKENFIDVVNNILLKCDDILHIVINLKDVEDAKTVRNFFNNKIPELEFLIMQDSFSNNKYFDIFIKGNSKYNSILKVANLENMTEDDIICFGDGLNDVDMLKNAKVGVAMGNALNEVKKVADFITNSNDEDGIISFLEMFLKGD